MEDVLMGNYPNTLADGMKEWRTAREHLANAIQTFYDASAALELLLSATVDIASSQLGSSLGQFDVQLAELAADSNRLDESLTRLKIMRNGRGELAPIQKLPEEVLARIFSILVGWDTLYCDHATPSNESLKNWKSYATVLSGVNVFWRWIMVNTPSFWSHIDVSLDSDRWYHSAFSLLCLQRVKDTPIELHIFSKSRHSDPDSGLVPALPEYLRDQTVASLNLICKQGDLVQPIIRVCLDNASPKRLTSLKVRIVYPPKDRSRKPAISSHGELFSNLWQLHTLSLGGIHIDWKHAKFSGLVDLELDSIKPENCPSLEQLHSVLITSPALSTFRLCDVKIQAHGSSSVKSMTPVKLPKLTFLGLRHLEVSLVDSLLRLIRPPLGLLCLSVVDKTSNCQGILDVLGPFCVEHQISTLSLCIPSLQHDPQQLALFLSALTNIRTLNLAAMPLLHEFIEVFCPESAIVYPASRLQGLRLLECSITLSALQRIVYTHSIRWLRLDNCFYLEEPSDDGSEAATYHHNELPVVLLEWLKTIIPDVYIAHISGTAPVYESVEKGIPWWLSLL